MRTRRLLIAIFLSPLAGCAGTAAPHALPPDHPANPQAPEAALPALSRTLAIGEMQPSPSDESETPMTDMQHMGHGMEHDMPGMSHGTSHAMPATTQAAAVYTCRMHPQVISDHAGKCPKCGMKLIPKKDANALPQNRGRE